MPDPASLQALGLLGMFLAAFLAGSILPFPSEVVLAGLIRAGASPPATVVSATLGNVLGAVTVYLIGRALARGSRHWLVERWRKKTGDDPAAQARAKERLERLGTGALLFAWLPVVGDAFVLAAGLSGVRPLWFLLFVTTGKAARYVVLAWSVASLA